MTKASLRRLPADRYCMKQALRTVKLLEEPDIERDPQLRETVIDTIANFIEAARQYAIHGNAGPKGSL